MVEVVFTIIAGHARAIYNAAHMGDRVYILVANEVLAYTALGNLVVDKDKSQTHCQLMGLENPKWATPRAM